MYNSGKIFNIQRFSTSDGPGIRIVVFLKGCPLNCIWCHNPESKSYKTEIFYQQDSCIGCGGCLENCQNDCHIFANSKHIFNRKKCVNCRECIQNCPAKALKACGEEKCTEEIMATIMRDKQFYDSSGGGLTVSGGEPLFQYYFTLSLFKLAKKYNLHTALETSGFTNRDLTLLRQYVDLWLYDIKLFSEREHIKYTGVSNKKIFENLILLDRIGAKIILRCPIIPNVNFSKEHFQELAMLANKLSNIVSIHLEDYHPLGISKAQQLGKISEYQNNCFLEKSSLENFSAELKASTNKDVRII